MLLSAWFTQTVGGPDHLACRRMYLAIPVRHRHSYPFALLWQLGDFAEIHACRQEEQHGIRDLAPLGGQYQVASTLRHRIRRSSKEQAQVQMRIAVGENSAYGSR